MTYCAVATLSLLGHLDESGLQSVDGLTRWLVHRQVPFEKKDEMDEDDWQYILECGTEEEKADGTKVELGTDGRPIWGGFHGRCNKKADTCYSFWIGASLDVGLPSMCRELTGKDVDECTDVEEALLVRYQRESEVFAGEDAAYNRWLHEAATAGRKSRLVACSGIAQAGMEDGRLILI
jgi:prenyltransferase beta subunit